jgi:colanic acid/amylovoran biosynthesis protein
LTKKFIITAGTLTGNRGSEAMVTTCIQQIKIFFPDSEIYIATYYPKDDLKEIKKPFFKKFKNLFIYSITPCSLVFQCVPLALISKILPFLKNNSAKQCGTILDLLKADLVLDVAGVSFIDGRKKFLLFNILSILPYIIHNIKIIKLPQAMGPFHNFINRIAAKIILSKCTRVYARGQRTMQHVQKLNIKKKLYLSPDITFSLKHNNVKEYKKRKKKYIAFVPSSLVMSIYPNYIEHLAKSIDQLQNKNFEIKLIVHSWRDNSKPRNNDLIAAEEINKHLENKIEIIGYGKNSTQIREEISSCKLIVVSRFHAMIAALYTFTPMLVIGWSHKYKEIMDDFELKSEYYLDYSDIDYLTIAKKINSIYLNGNQISNKIKKKLPIIKKKTEEMFSSIFNDIKN